MPAWTDQHPFLLVPVDTEAEARPDRPQVPRTGLNPVMVTRSNRPATA